MNEEEYLDKAFKKITDNPNVEMHIAIEIASVKSDLEEFTTLRCESSLEAIDMFIKAHNCNEVG